MGQGLLFLKLPGFLIIPRTLICWQDMLSGLLPVAGKGVGQGVLLVFGVFNSYIDGAIIQPCIHIPNRAQGSVDEKIGCFSGRGIS
jgi:hypothetical protein